MNKEKVREIFEELNKVIDNKYYSEFEVAYLIMERLSNIVDTKEDITDEIIDKVYNIAQDYDTLLSEYVNEDLDNLENEYLREMEG